MTTPPDPEQPPDLRPRVPGQSPDQRPGALGQPPDQRPRAPGAQNGRPTGRARDFVAEENRSRLVNLALSHLRNGREADARKIVDELRASAPEDAAVQELVGDIAASRGEWKAAMAAFKESLALEPGRPSAETKLARGALQQFEVRRLQEGGAAAFASSPGLARQGSADGRRHKLAIFASALIPGAGHFLLGQHIKALILIGIYFLLTLLLASLPESHAFMKQAAQMMSPERQAVSTGGSSGVLPIFLCIVLTVEWLYAVGDTVHSARSQA